MVTLLKPSPTESTTEYLEAPVQSEDTNAVNIEPVQYLEGIVAGPSKAQHNSGFISGITHPLLALYELMSGPAISQRDRYRRKAGEAAVRDAVTLAWFNRTTWL